MRKISLLLLLALFLSGCATMFSQKLKPGMIWMEIQPLAKYEKDPEVNFSKYKNFSVFPQSEIDKESKNNPIVEKQLLFMLRNRLESLGYNYVADVMGGDFIMGISYSNEYKTQYIPPSSYTIPWHVPGQTQTTFLNNYNTFSGNIGSDYFHGSGSGWGTATTTTPGYYVPMTFSNPGGYVGWYYPCFVVSVFDKNSKKLVWSGSVIGVTSNPDVRLSGQVLLSDLFGRKESNFPVSNDYDKKDDSKDGAFGILASPYTIDGNNFYPHIFSVVVDSPAYKQNLKPGDVISKVDGQSTLNWSLPQLLDAMNKSKGESLATTIQRNGNTFDVNLIAEDERVAKNKWKEVITLDEKWRIKRVKIPKVENKVVNAEFKEGKSKEELLISKTLELVTTSLAKQLEQDKQVKNTEVADFARQHEDFEQVRQIMYELSLDPQNKDLSLQELYDKAKKRIKK